MFKFILKSSQKTPEHLYTYYGESGTVYNHKEAKMFNTEIDIVKFLDNIEGDYDKSWEIFVTNSSNTIEISLDEYKEILSLFYI